MRITFTFLKNAFYLRKYLEMQIALNFLINIKANLMTNEYLHIFIWSYIP